MKDLCMQVCQDILEHLYSDPDLLKRIIIDDKTWVFQQTSESLLEEPSITTDQRSKVVKVQNHSRVHIIFGRQRYGSF